MVSRLVYDLLSSSQLKLVQSGLFDLGLENIDEWSAF